MRRLLAAFSVFAFTQTAMAKTFVYCSEASPKIFNPQLATDGPTFNASSQPIYNRLVEFASGSTTLTPALAKSWKVSKDGKSVTFQLRDDVDFHSNKKFTPTRKFNADDVLFTFNRMRLKDHPYHRVGGGTYEYFKSMDMGSLIVDIKKIGPHEVEFALSRPEAPFLANIAMDFASILSAEYGERLAAAGTLDKMDVEPIGTGPFRFKKYDKDNMIRYERFDQHFRGPAKIQNLVFAITPDANVRLQKLKTGECHLMTDPSPTDVDAITKTSGLKLLEKPGANIGYLSFNVKKKPFDNVLVRQAIHHALNREAYIDAIYMGRAMVAKNPIPPTLWGYNDGVVDYTYDVEKAKQLLKKAGLPNGFEVELWTLPVSRPYNPNGKKLGELMQADLDKVGIKVKLVTYKWATYLEKAAQGEHQLLQLGWVGDNGDPDNFFSVLLSCAAVNGGSNYSRWCDKDFSQLVDKARSVSDVKERTGFYKKAGEIFKAQAPWVTIAHASVYRALSDKVAGYKVSPNGTENFYDVDLK